MKKLRNHAKLLAEMIPPLSSPAGGMRLRMFAENTPYASRAFDMENLPFKDTALWPDTRPGKSPDQIRRKRWLHGDYKDAPFRLTHMLYEEIRKISE